MALNITLDTPKILRTIIESISSNLTEGIYFEFTESGLQILISIAGSVWAVEAKIDKDKFSRYELKDNVVVQLRLKEVSDFIKTASANETLHLSLEDGVGRIKLTLSKENTERTITLGLLAVEESYRFKNLANFTQRYKGSFTISSSLYQEAIKTVALGGSHISVSMTKDGIRFDSKGITKNAEVTIARDNEEIQNFKYDDESDQIISHFGIEYLMNLTKFSKISDAMLICLGTTAPILCIFGSEEIDHVAVAIAPRNE